MELGKPLLQGGGGGNCALLEQPVGWGDNTYSQPSCVSPRHMMALATVSLLQLNAFPLPRVRMCTLIK